jgi:enoyl-CoA hydratase/carnithine racemase
MVMLAERIDGELAKQWGLIHEVAADEDLLDELVSEWVKRCLALPPLSVHMAKYQMRGYAQVSRLGDISEFDGDASALAMRSDEAKARFGSFGSG